MKDKKWLNTLTPLVIPALLIILGIVLIVRPDSAAALIGKVVAFSLLLTATVLAIAGLSGDVGSRIYRLIISAILLALGLWLLLNPLFIAKSLGRILGILLILEGGSAIGDALRWKYPFPVVALITLVAGIVLVLVPMTASRLVFTICGIVVLCIGVAELAEKLLGKRRPKKSDIIDIE